MIPYESLYSFYILLLFALPAAVLGLAQKSRRLYVMVFTAVLFFFVFDTEASRLAAGIFFAVETLVCFGFHAFNKKYKKRPALWAAVALSLLPLLLAKYTGGFTGFTLSFLGISYMTFRAVSLLIDSYDGKIDRLSLVDFTSFLLFVPSAGAGPIDSYQRFCGDNRKIYTRNEYAGLIYSGVWNLLTGAFYNFAVAALIANMWLDKIPDGGFFNGLQTMYAYTFYLFFNFAGYSKMAVGAANILGIKTPGNFDMPFLAKDMKDFWSRWHMSLSFWLRDYVYARFVTAALKGKWFKSKRASSYIGYGLNMMIMGLWHGTAPFYIVYGAYHGLLMCVNDVLDVHWKGFKKLKRSNAAHPVMALVTFHLAAFGLLIFSGRLF